MKILILVDKDSSAIAKLAKIIQKYNQGIKIKVQALHPKRPPVDQIDDSIRALAWCDILHVSYWKSGEKLKELDPLNFEKKLKLVAMHNPYDVLKQSWLETYSSVTVNNSHMLSKIPYAQKIINCVDLEKYDYIQERPEQPTVQMCVNRIEGKKGIVEVAQVTKELGYKFILVGRISNSDCMKAILLANPDIDFRESVTEEEVVQSYYEAQVHVCNSADNFESGTMPILEAMACGTAVLTRNIGHVPDLYNGGNMIVRVSARGDTEGLKGELKSLMTNEMMRKRIVDKAWNTVKNYGGRKYARQYSDLYFRMWSENQGVVSAIVPTMDNPHIMMQCLVHLIAQDYPYMEIIVADSSNDDTTEVLVDQFRKQTDMVIKYIKIEKHGDKDYTLPRARNLGVIEAQGAYIFLCDERILPERGAVTAFMDRYTPMSWLFGVKDDAEKGFVENFSFVSREELIRFGMFNERIDCYGGASQEIRSRFPKHGIMLERVNDARAKGIGKSSNKWRKRQDIIRAKFINWKIYGGKE